MVKKYVLQWKKGNASRYYINGTGYEIQIGKYREHDDFEKYMKIKPTWQGKWYVDDMHGNEQLFDTQKEAQKYLIKRRDEIYRTKQLNKN